MNAPSTVWNFEPVNGNSPGLVFRQAHWGVKIANVSSIKKLRLAELFLRSVGFSIFILAIMALSSVSETTSSEAFVKKIFQAALAAFGLGLYCFATKGLLSEVHIDEARREIRIGTRNASGMMSTVRVLPLRDIESIFIRRADNKKALVSLQLRAKDDGSAITLLRGQEAELVSLMEYIADLSLQKQKRRPRTKTTGRFIRADFAAA